MLEKIFMDLLTSVKNYIRHHSLLKPKARVIVGVSGGPDSVVLLHLLTRLAKSWRLHLHVAHLHHGIRGADADADAAFVAELSERWGWSHTLKRADIPTLAASVTSGRDNIDENENQASKNKAASKATAALEETARRVRYAFLIHEAQRYSADCIAVGHNANDQAETVLMHLLRGAGPAGLRGMLPITPLPTPRTQTSPPGSIPLIRPLLNTSREAIETYCETHDLQTRLDRSNLDTAYFRNHIRHQVLPYLEEVRSGICERLTNLAEIIRADYELLEEFVQVAWDTLLTNAYPDAVVFNLAGWRAQSLSVQRALIRRAVYEITQSRRDVSFSHVENAVQIAQRGHTGAQATLPYGLNLRIGYTTLTIADQEACHLPIERPWLTPGDHIPVNLAAMAAVTLKAALKRPTDKPHPSTSAMCPPIGKLRPWILTAEIMKQWNYTQVVNNPNPLTAWMDADRVDAMLVDDTYLYLRTRKQGDHFHPLGLGGATVRLSDLFINVKLPLAWRDHLPLLATNGEILWVVGIRLSQCVMVRPETRRVLRLRFLRHSEAALGEAGRERNFG